jgi:glycosyltransferase involved in cell wall biosynthesis
MRLSLCLIARDEAQRLERCLESVRGVVDECVVLDTGSRDGTPELAQRLGARTASFAWCDDFAAARNACLELATGHWALVLDADEALATPAAEARATVEAFARAHGGRLGRLWIENVEDGCVQTRARLARLIPLDGAHRYAGRVHEQVVRDGAPALAADLELVVRHDGYSRESLARGDKLSRNTRLLERAVDDAPDDGYLWYQLGRTRALAGDPVAALEALEGALSLCRDDDPWAIAALEEGAYALRALEASAQALALLETVEERFRARPDTCFLIALLAMDTGDLSRAEAGFHHCLALGQGDPSGAESSPASATVAPAFNLGVMSEVQGRLAEARAHYQRALAFQPGHAAAHAALQRISAA